MKIIRGTVFGGISFFFLGWLVWGILLAGLMETMYNPGLSRPDNEMIWWALIVSNLALALLITLGLKWAGAKSAKDGLKVGAIIGGLYALTVDLGMYSMTTSINDFTGVIVDVLAYTVLSAIIGLVIVLTWGKEKSA